MTLHNYNSVSYNLKFKAGFLVKFCLLTVILRYFNDMAVKNLVSIKNFYRRKNILYVRIFKILKIPTNVYKFLKLLHRKQNRFFFLYHIPF